MLFQVNREPELQKLLEIRPRHHLVRRQRKGENLAGPRGNAGGVLENPLRGALLGDALEDRG